MKLRSPASALAALAAAGLGACDARPPITAVGPDAASGDPFSRAGDFDVAGCASGGLAGIAPAGIWHLEIAFGYGRAPAAVRLDAGPGEAEPGALLFGNPADPVDLGPDAWLVRRAFALDDGRERVQAVFLCADAAGAAGDVLGAYASCTAGVCGVSPARGARVEPLPEPPARGVRQIASFAGPDWPAGSITVNVRQRGGVAYLARYGDGLRIVDVTGPEPVERGHAPVRDPELEIYNDVKLADGPGGRVYALMASSRRGVVAIDVTDPGAPVEAAVFPDDPLGQVVNVHALFVDGARAYAANISRGGVDVLDVADPARPALLGRWAHPAAAARFAFVHDLYVEAGRMYLDYWNLGMVIADASGDPADPDVLGLYEGYGGETSHSSWVARAGGRAVAVHGDEGYGAHARIVDVDPASPAFLDTLASYQTRPQVSVHNVMAHGAMALITYYQDGLRLIDISDPSRPVEVGHFSTWPGPEPGYGASFYEGAVGLDFEPATGTIYLADTHRGLLVLALE